MSTKKLDDTVTMYAGILEQSGTSDAGTESCDYNAYL